MLGRIGEKAGTVKVRFIAYQTPDGLTMQEYLDISKAFS